MNESVRARISAGAERISKVLKSYLPTAENYNRSVVEAMTYSVENGGKRLRPLLMCEIYSLGGKPESEIYPLAAALEFIHCYSLIHDDLPCMDNSDLRRGKPSTHKKFGEWQALLAGDGLLNFAFETALNNNTAIPPERFLRCLVELAAAAGPFGMIGGQNLDLESENKNLDKSGLLLLQSKKTGALIRAAGRIGAIASGADEDTLKLADGYCSALGSAFQICDDILDACGDEELLGKPIGGDNASAKATFVTVMGLDNARKEAMRYTIDSVGFARELGSPFLEELATYLAQRED